MHIAVHTTAAVYRHQESRLPAKFGPWSHDWRRYARRRTGDDDDVVSDDESLEVLFGIRSRAELEASRSRRRAPRAMSPRWTCPSRKTRTRS